jgi:hypothetical protein
MSYSFYLISKEKPITQEDYDKAFSNLSPYNQKGSLGGPPCDIYFEMGYICVSGTFGISGHHVEGFVLNLLMCLSDLDYKITILSKAWNYGSEADWKWLNNLRLKKYEKIQ